MTNNELVTTGLQILTTIATASAVYTGIKVSIGQIEVQLKNLEKAVDWQTAETRALESRIGDIESRVSKIEGLLEKRHE